MSSTLDIETGPTALKLRQLKQMVKEGDARVAAADKNHLNGVDMLISAGQIYKQASEFARSIGTTFTEALTRAESPVGERFALKCIAFADADDPEAAVLAYRNKNKDEAAEYRKRLGKVDHKAAKVRADAAIRNLPPEEPENVMADISQHGEVVDLGIGGRDLTSWTAPEREVDPVDGIMLRVDELTREEFVRFVNRVTERARQLGLVT